jgi:glycosyltransferase involved in cell wall biosynthesis
MDSSATPKLSVVIKALNEEAHIEKAIASVRAATRNIPTEIILADSLSTDRTVELAARFGIAILQLTDPTQRSCGIGPEMGFRHASGEFLLLVDGDMEVAENFPEVAIERMSEDRMIAGVGGLIQEKNVDNLEFKNRNAANSSHLQPGDVDRLNCGGMFRRSALESVGYFTNRNLHSFEEFELGLRLKAAGYRLLRLERTGLYHHGHSTPTLQLLKARVRTGYARGPGELIRASLGQPWFGKAVCEFRSFILALVWWLFLAISLLVLPWTPVAVFVAVLSAALITLVMVFRKRSFSLGAYAPLAWSVFGLNSVVGFLRKPRPVTGPLPVVVIREGDMPSRA